MAQRSLLLLARHSQLSVVVEDRGASFSEINPRRSEEGCSAQGRDQPSPMQRKGRSTTEMNRDGEQRRTTSRNAEWSSNHQRKRKEFSTRKLFVKK
jgi:hypothetical protein